MDKIRYGKSGSWVAPVGVLLRLFALIAAQPGFLSISCGGKTNHTAENNITWVIDAPYIDVGKAAEDSTELGSYLYTRRYFPKPLNKSCYQLPVTPDVPHLLRLWFSPRISPEISFALSIETVDHMLFAQNISMADQNDEYVPFFYEYILVTTGRVLYICLVRTFDEYDPHISAIEMRRLQYDMYKYTYPRKILVTLSRNDVGGNSTVRYPHDEFDRIWTPIDPSISGATYLKNVSSTEPISANNTYDLPPTAVLQTAWVLNSSDSIPLHYSSQYFGISSDPTQTLLLLYFAEIKNLNMSETRSFLLEMDGELVPDLTITLVRNYSIEEVLIMGESKAAVFSLIEGSDSTLPPIINAFEYYELRLSDESTYYLDIDALNAIKSRLHIKEWISADPCYLIPWDSIVCVNSSGNIRISEIDLSGRNLTGSVPSDFANLTALVHLSLDHNHLTGPMPNLANLTRLERLYLQNNNLNGTVEWLSGLISLQELSLDHNQFTGPMPNLANLSHLERLYLQNNKLNGNVDWLSDLINLKEINIENNNFSGVFPPQILLDCSLKLNYSGNPYLRIGKRECNIQKNYTKLVVVLGILFIALMVDKFIKLIIIKERVPRGAEKEPIHKDRSMNMVPNATKSRAFTLNEMTAATQGFSREIGRGGFGSVFFGKLPHGKLIAVKVLSVFSRQGIHEFLNEVDLLSKINHRNLVSLLGYCNETDEVMLVYEHMSRGSLRDHLYGPRAENSDLNWKRRLKIALDAAQGLEYLHVGCTPKIIHRDIKTANILLDSNLNGKLADFGLSRITTDEEGTHVTTTVKGTIGYLDPEYYNTQMLTEKSDVYSFGVVLLEIMSGRPPIDTNLAEEEINIVRWVTPYLLEMDGNGGQISEIIDKRFCGGYDMKSISNIAKIAMRCAHALPSCRPTVSEIVTELKEAIKVEEDMDCVSIAEENGIQNGDVSTKREGMEWNDDSSNMPNVGR